MKEGPLLAASPLFSPPAPSSSPCPSVRDCTWYWRGRRGSSQLSVMSDVAKSSSQKSKFGYSEVYSLSTSVSTTTSRTKIQSIISNVKRIVYRVMVSREKKSFFKAESGSEEPILWNLAPKRAKWHSWPVQYCTVLWTIALLYRTTGTTVLCTDSVWKRVQHSGVVEHTQWERESEPAAEARSPLPSWFTWIWPP